LRYFAKICIVLARGGQARLLLKLAKSKEMSQDSAVFHK